MTLPLYLVENIVMGVFCLIKCFIFSCYGWQDPNMFAYQPIITGIREPCWLQFHVHCLGCIQNMQHFRNWICSVVRCRGAYLACLLGACLVMTDMTSLSGLNWVASFCSLHLMMETHPVSRLLCIVNIPQTMASFHHNIYTTVRNL